MTRRSALPGFGLSLGLTLFWVSLIVIIPVAAVFIRSFGDGWQHFLTVGFSSRAMAAYRVTFGAAALATLINAVFGLLVAWVLVRFDFPGRRMLSAAVDLPFALPTAVAGIALTAIYANTGWIGIWLEPLGIKITVKQLAIEQWLAELGDFPPLSFMWYFNTTGDPAELSAWFLADGNPAQYKNAAVAALIGSAAAIQDPGKRADVVMEAQRASAADLPYLPLWWGRSSTAFASNIGVNDYSPFTFNSPWPLAVYPATPGAS